VFDPGLGVFRLYFCQFLFGPDVEADPKGTVDIVGIHVPDDFETFLLAGDTANV